MKSVIAVVLGAAFLVTPVVAQEDYPTRAITVVVPYSPGGDNDLQGRMIASGLSREFGKPVIVENRPGAGTSLGTVHVLQQPADGYTVLVTSHSLVTSSVTLANPGYDPSDFVPLGLISVDANVLLTTDKIPAKTLPDFLKYASENSGKLNFASISPGGNGQMLAVRLGDVSGFEWEGLPYSGDQDALLALLRGEVQAYFGGATTALPLGAEELAGGPLPKLNFLAIASKERSSAIPDVPTFTELGYPDMVEELWTAVYVRKDTPPAVVDKLRTTVAKVIASPEVAESLANMKLSPYTGTLEEFEQMMKSKAERVKAHMERFGIAKN